LKDTAGTINFLRFISRETAHTMYEVNRNDRTSYVSCYFHGCFRWKGVFKVIFGDVISYFIDKWKYLGNGTGMLQWMTNRMWYMCSIELHHYQWPWATLKVISAILNISITNIS